MKFDLSAAVYSLDGRTVSRNELDAKYSDTPLTLAFMAAHVVSQAVEDLNVYVQQATQMSMSPNPDHEKVRELQKQTRKQKQERGELALRLLADDDKDISLSAAECELLLDVATPRLMPIMLTQLMRVIN